MSIINEVEWQREQLLEYYKRKCFETGIGQGEEGGDEEEDYVFNGSQVLSGSSSTFNSTRIMRRAMRGAGHRRGGVSTPAKARPLKRTKSAIMRSHYVREAVSQLPRKLKRSLSFPLFTSELTEVCVQEPNKIYSQSRRNSLPDVLNFDALMKAKTKSSNIDPQQWVESLWDEWFYEVLAEVRAAIAELNQGRRPLLIWQSHIEVKSTPVRVKDKKKDTVKTQQLGEVELVDIPPLLSVDIEVCRNKAEELTNQIIASDGDQKLKAELLSERGALYRKCGQLVQSMADLTEALSLSSSITSPHWDKHLLLLIQGKYKLAADELTLLLKKDNTHSLAFQSKAAILSKRGDLSDAIHNCTQAISLEPNNSKLYFLRAELREQRGEIQSSLNDYATVVTFEPQNEHALMRQAVHTFDRKFWYETTQILTSLLNINCNNMKAWLLRSQAQLNMGNHKAALQDLSAAIHLNPNNAKLFYQRGCLLRSYNYERSLKDFSISLLIDDTANNSPALLHRGVVYTQMKCYDEAYRDFIAVSQLDSTLPSAHTNAGLILMNQKHNPRDAVRHFTAGLFADPTYTRALLCRAEAYTQLGNLQAAILDWTRAIHCTPNNPSLHLNQGKVYLQMKNYSRALSCIKTASKLGSGVGSSPAQQSLVHSFLGEHEQAISKLQSQVKGHTSIPLYTVLGKVQLKARLFDEAVESFREAIKNINLFDVHSTSKNKTLKTELHYLCGRSLLGSGKFKQAAEEFSKVISAQPDNTWAHYYRGISLLRMGSSKGMLSINQSLMLKPDLIEGYLTRASYYGKLGRLSKAILNCSEAIRLQPNSVRAYLYRGVLRHQMGFQKVAIKDLSEAISLSPNISSLAVLNRAIFYQTTGNTQNALRDYSMICLMEETPSHKVLINRGLLYFSISDYHNALYDFNLATKFLPQDPSLWQAVALCYHKLGELHNAIECYTTTINIDPLFIEAYIGRANVYTEFLNDKGNRKAKSDYLHVLHQYPTCLSAQVNLSLLLQCEGKHMMAWKQLTALLSVNKDYIPALEARAIISLQNSNTFGSLLDINRAISLKPTAQLLTERGVIHQYMKDMYNAVRDYERAIQLDPHQPLALYNMGNALLQQRLYIQAITMYSKVISLVKGDEGALVNRGICYVAVGDDENALLDFSNAINSNPCIAHAYFNRANLLKSMGRLQEAEYDYNKALELQSDDPVTLNYHGNTLGLLGKNEEATKQFVNAANIETPV